jgi:type II secretory pathway component HofQ
MPRVSLFVVMAGFLVFAFPSFQSQYPQPSGSPTSPANSSHGQTSPPPQASPQKQESADANRRIHDSVADLLSSDPVLSGADVNVTVDDKNITLTGTVDNHAQHERVLQLVAQYGRWRNIVDQIK